MARLLFDVILLSELSQRFNGMIVERTIPSDLNGGSTATGKFFGGHRDMSAMVVAVDDFDRGTGG